MKIKGGSVQFSSEEYSEYSSVWGAVLSEDPSLESRRLDLVKRLRGADEIEVMKGRDPLSKEIFSFIRLVQDNANKLRPDLGEEGLSDFSFFLFNCNEQELRESISFLRSQNVER